MNKKLLNLFFTASKICILAICATPLMAQTVTVNGALDISEGYQLKCLQDNYTQFGNSTTGTIITSPSGSELDGAYAKIANNTLYLMITGNLEGAPNSNRLEIFMDTKTGGQNVLTNTNNKPSDFENPNKMAGIKFDAGFESDYWFTIGSFMSGANYKSFIYCAATDGDSINGFIDNPVPDIQLNSTGGPYNWTYQGGKIGWNNSNVAGVGGALGEVGGTFDPATVITGIELAIPLAYLGNPTGDIKVCAFINSAAHDYVSNQVLCGLGGNAVNLQSPTPGANYLNGVDFSAVANDQYFVVSQTTDIKTPFEVGALSIHPMPAKDAFTIHLASGYSVANYTDVMLFNLNGVEVQKNSFATVAGTNDFEVRVSELPAGVYVATIVNGNYIQREKIVVVK